MNLPIETTNRVGAPLGNKNAAKAHIFYDAVKRAIAQDDGKRLRAAAEKLLDLDAEGTPWAVQELANRLDGKPSQSVALTGDDGGPVQLGFKVVLGNVA